MAANTVEYATSAKSPDKNNTTQPAQTRKASGVSIRYAVLVLSVLALAAIMANIVCFNFTVLCMPGTGEEYNANNTYKGYSKDERTWLFSAIAVGALIAILPASLLITSVGTRKTFFIAGILSALSTALIPFAAQNHIVLFLLLRFLQGVAFAACMPVVGSVVSSWSPLTQAGLFMSALTCLGHVASVVSMPLSGMLCTSSLGWTSVFYTHALIALVIFVLWVVVYRNDPAQHSLVSGDELSQIAAGKALLTTSRLKVPYAEILSTPSVWGILWAAFGDQMAVELIHTFAPLYIKNIFLFSVQKTGWAAALPILFQFLVKVSAGYSSDRIRCVSETTKLRVFNSVALGASACFMLGLAFLPKGHPTLGVFLITATTAMFGFNGAGFNKSAALVSRQYAHFVMGSIQLLWCLAMLICPIVVGFVLDDASSETDWRNVYILHAVLLLVSNAVFCLLVTSKPAAFTDRSKAAYSKRNTPIIKLTEFGSAKQ